MIKIAFFGTPDFAGEILSGILEYPEVDCKLVVSQPDKAVGRKKEFVPTPVKQVAEGAGIKIMQPEKMRKNIDFHKYLKSLDLDFVVVVAYGKIIPKVILDTPRYGCINIHGSILPKYRGASPVQAAIKAGEKETGLTTMYMSEGMDEGDILQIGKVKVDNVDTSLDIFQKFVEVGPELLVDTLKKIKIGELDGIPQENLRATYCSKISREDGKASFQKQTAQDIYNTFRAYTPWPGIFSLYNKKRFVFEAVQIIDEVGKNPGEFVKLGKNRYGVVCCDKKIIEVKQLKLEGKKSMDITSFVNGNRDVLGYIFA